MNFDKRLLKLARENSFTLALSIALGLLAGIFTVLQARILSRIAGLVFLQGDGLAGVSGLLGVMLAILLVRAALAGGSELAASAMAVRIKTELRLRFFSHMQSLGPGYTSGERSGELVSVAVEGIEALDQYFSQYLPQLALAALIPLTFLAFIIPLDPLSGAVLLLTAPLIPLFMILIGSKAAGLTRRQWQTLSRMSAYFLDVIQGLVTLKTLGRSRDQASRIAQASDRFRQVTMSVLRVAFLSALVLEMVSTLSTAVVAVEVGLRLLSGRLAYEQALFVLLLAPEFYLPLRMLGTRFHAGMSALAAAKRIFAVLDASSQPASSQPIASQEAAPPPARFLAASPSPVTPFPIEFEQVSYTYPGRPQALDGVTFKIAAGQKVALVGPSGAGKSTIANLLLRFCEPGKGRITAGGASLSGIPPDAWRAQVAWVSQNPYLFQDTVEANIRLACPQASQEEIMRAARLAQADEFIRELPEGYATRVGERGLRLSAGQAQRIALARAFLKNAPLLILDEATANLDPENEALIRKALDRLLEGCTALIIAHRLSTVYQASQILVIDRGGMVEAGTHAGLLNQNGLYSRLVTAYSGRAEISPEILDWSEEDYLPPLSVSLPDAYPDPGPLPLTPYTPVPQVQRTCKVRPQACGRTYTTPFLRLLAMVAPFKGLVALSVLLGFAAIASGIGLMATSAYLISAAALHPSIALLQVPIVGVRFFGISRGLFRYLERYYTHQVAFHMLARLRTWFYQALEPLAPARLMQAHSGDLLARMIGDIEALESFYVRVLAPPLVAIAIALAMAVFMARFDPLLAAVLLACLLLSGMGVPFLIRLLSRSPGAALVSRRAALSAALVDGIQGMADLFAFGREQAQLQKIAAAGQELARAQRRLAATGSLQTALSSLAANLGMWAILVLSIWRVEPGQIDGVYLAMLALAALASFEAVQPLPQAAQQLETNLEAARRLFAIVDAAPEIREPEEPSPASAPPACFSLEVRGLSFCYPAPAPSSRGAGEIRVLEDLTFNLPQGKSLAILGPSGAGKTTLVNLLLRFWEYREGEILLGGRDLKAYRPDDLRRSLAVVSQHTYLFNASLRDNLLIARPQACEEEMIRAAEQARIHDFICSLPQGYDTWIGEQGVRLSGGERQRLAIARALIKDAPMLILDEPTANLDALTERQVLAGLGQLMPGRTTLMITHRLAGLEMMDEILVLRKGRIVERGRHADLLALGGYYRQMYDLQNWLMPVQLPVDPIQDNAQPIHPGA